MEAAVPDKITISELQGLSASAIQALPYAVPIKNGDETAGLLLPIKKASPELIASVFAKIDADAAKRTPEEQTEIEAFLDGLERE